MTRVPSSPRAPSSSRIRWAATKRSARRAQWVRRTSHRERVIFTMPLVAAEVMLDIG